MIVGASGSILTNLMAEAMNRSIPSIIAGGFGGVVTTGGGAGEDGVETTVRSTAPPTRRSRWPTPRVVIVPGYGMAVAQAQHAVREMTKLLEEQGRGGQVRHPPGRRAACPGHMNVLLAEADVPYDQLKEMDDINPEFARTDVSLVIGANDVTNPDARNEGRLARSTACRSSTSTSRRSVIVLKRSMNTGFAGIDNPLFYSRQDRDAVRRRQVLGERDHRGAQGALSRRSPSYCWRWAPSGSRCTWWVASPCTRWVLRHGHGLCAGRRGGVLCTMGRSEDRERGGGRDEE